LILQPFYRPPDKNLWQGRQDIIAMERFHQVVTVKEVTECLAAPMINPTIVFIGFGSDEGVRRNQGRVGAKAGPDTLRKALANYPLHGGKKKIVQLIDIGNIECNDESLEDAQKALATVVEQVVAQGGFPIVLGGGHETAWGHYQGLSPKWEKSNFAIVNFDAHFDMRQLHEGNKSTSGTSFLQIAQQRKDRELPFHYYCLGIKLSSNTQSLFATAHQWGAKYLTCDDIYEGGVIPHFINKIVSRHDAIYVSVCLDVFDESYAPGVSAPSPYGLQPWHVLKALHLLSGSGKVVALDVVELAPNYDHNDITAKLGASCIADFIYNWPATQVQL
jgi:formiminoglutamase